MQSAQLSVLDELPYGVKLESNLIESLRHFGRIEGVTTIILQTEEEQKISAITSYYHSS